MLVLQLLHARRLHVGALGARDFAAGCYLYVGSAFGPGGLRARLGRHAVGGRPRWHVDHLRRHSRLLEVWWTADAVRREHDWVRALAAWLGRPGEPGFGASDSPLASHLFHAGAMVPFTPFYRHVLSVHHDHASLHCTSCAVHGKPVEDHGNE